VIDFVAPSLAALLERADGRTVSVAGEETVLRTADLTLVEREPGLRSRILAVITDPNVALLLMVFGFYGIVFELLSPGALVPGTVGGISLLTGLYALSVLPVSFAGAGLMLLGLALVVAEIFAPSFGILGIGGAVAVSLGAMLLFEGDVPGLELSLAVVAATGVGSAALALLAARFALVSHRRKVTTGLEQLIGAEVEVMSWAGAEGFVHVHGERWRARAAEPGRFFAPGAPAVVTAVDGLTLHVAPRPAPDALRS
jgi:membrane-bound serine protease (ClpP class)